jgi:hypothetical protein
MVLKFSTWLRETVRLYLRYTAIALGGIPFALAATWAKQAHWHERIILPVVSVCAVAIAFALWKWMGDWQLRPKVPMRPFEAEWADLLKVAIGSGELLQCRVTLDESSWRTWQDVMLPAVIGSVETTMIELYVTRANQSPPVRVSNDEDVLQQMMMGKIRPSRRPRSQRMGEPEVSAQIVSAQPLFGPQPALAGSH